MTTRVASILLVASLALGCAGGSARRPTVEPPTAATWRDALVVDASSSASTLFAFRWRPGTAGALPEIESVPLPESNPDCEPIEPGLGDYGERLDEVAAAIEPLIRCAVDLVGDDPEVRRRAAFHLRGTAGLRLLPAEQQAAVRDRVLGVLGRSPFGETSARVITGEEEGIFGWLTVNYLLGHLEHGGSFPTVGALDLGGASTQITFVPLDAPEDHAHTIRLANRTYHLYSYSYLGLGQDRARATVDSPACFLAGYPLPDGRVGTGDYDACREAIRAELSHPCEARSCSLFGVYQPPLYGDFLAFSVYFYASRFFGISGRLSAALLEPKAREFCATSWSELIARDPDAEGNPYVPTYCFSGAYIVTLLTDGWGFPFDSERIHTPRRVQGSPVGWTLGALLHELAGEPN